MADHTPGPPVRYEFDEHGGYDCMSSGYRVLDAAGRTCVTVDTKEFRRARMMESCEPLEEAEALARLIAAAPDMLAALKTVKGFDIYHGVLRFVDAAVAKAEGRS